MTTMGPTRAQVTGKSVNGGSFTVSGGAMLGFALQTVEQMSNDGFFEESAQ
jgi:hypothetical protein